MNADWHIRDWAASSTLPPTMLGETGWDVLLTLHADQAHQVSLDRLEKLVSAPRPVLDRWLAVLERRQLVTGVTHRFSGELRAVLTPRGRALLDTYLSATSVLQISEH